MDIRFYSPESLTFFKVNARYCLRSFVAFSNKLSLISLWVTQSGNTIIINTRQNQVKNRKPPRLTAGIERLSLPKIRENEDRFRTFEGKNLDWETRNKSIYFILKNAFLPLLGNERQIWLFHDPASSIWHRNDSKKVKTKPVPRKTRKLGYWTKNRESVLGKWKVFASLKPEVHQLILKEKPVLTCKLSLWFG